MQMLLSIFFKYLLAPFFVMIMLFILNSMKNLKQKLSMKKAIIFILISALIIALPCLFGLLRNEFVWAGLLLTICVTSDWVLYFGDIQNRICIKQSDCQNLP